MGTLLKAFNSTVARKLIMGLTGLGIVLFVMIHLAENLLLYVGPEQYNGYVVLLHSVGNLLYVAEFGLAATILIHAYLAIRITKANHDARGTERYAQVRSKGEPSHSSVSSRNMIYTGVILLGFLVLHLWQFRFGPGVAEGYVAQVNGKDAVDLYRLVSEIFHNPLYVAVYVGVMVFLGMHVRHGFWSAFQSLGAMTPQLSKPLYCLGLGIALLLALGFLSIPLWFYFGGH
jgi:succinate dehydrogenase / fumarate reductase cytochrome b subunit